MRRLTLLAVSALPVAPLVAQSAGLSPAALRQAVVAARLRLDTAIAAKDLAALAALLADDVMLVRRADTLRGRAAVVAFVAGGIAGVPDVRLNYAPAGMVECTATALDERDGEYVLFLSTYTRTDTLRGRYAARWVAAGDGTVRLAAVRLESRAARRAPRLGGCRVVPTAALARRRLLVTLPTPFATSGWNSVDDLDATIAARGYASGQQPGLLSSFPTRQEDAPLTVAARVAVRGPWSLEAYASLGAKRGDVRRYRAVDSSYFRARYTGRHGGIVLSYERSGVRVGAGPAVLRNTWATEEEQLWNTGSGWQTGGILGRGSATDVLVGVVAQTATVYAVSSRVYIEARAQLRRFAAGAVPGAGRVAGASVDHNGYTLALAIGGAL